MRIVLLLAVLAPAAMLAGVEEEIQAAEKHWAQSVVKKDFAALEKLYGAQLIYAHSTGVIENKTQYMARVKSGKQHYDGIEHQKLTVKEYGATAVAHAIIRLHGLSDTRKFDDTCMTMHVWVKQDGRWTLVAHQTTKLP